MCCRYYTDHLRHTFPLKIVLVGNVVMVGKVELDSTFPIIQTVCRRSPQTAGTYVFICLRRGTDLSAIVSQTVANHVETRLSFDREISSFEELLLFPLRVTQLQFIAYCNVKCSTSAVVYAEFTNAFYYLIE